jgi:hypothetical protein
MPPLPLVARYDRRVVLSVELLFPLLWRYLSCSWMLAWEIELPGADLNRLRESVLRPSRRLSRSPWNFGGGQCLIRRHPPWSV